MAFPLYKILCFISFLGLNYTRDIVVDAKIILRWISGESVVRVWTSLSQNRVM